MVGQVGYVLNVIIFKCVVEYKRFFQMIRYVVPFMKFFTVMLIRSKLESVTSWRYSSSTSALSLLASSSVL